TRSDRDWSSDVCSSELSPHPAPPLRPPAWALRSRRKRARVRTHLCKGEFILTRRQFTTTLTGGLAAGLLGPGRGGAQGAAIRIEIGRAWGRERGELCAG